MNTRRCVIVALAAAAMAATLSAQTPAAKLTWDQSASVQNRKIRPAESAERIDWDARVARLLKEEPGDIILTAVGDMIFNEQISQLREGERRNLYRIMREADLAYGNLEFSLNSHPELQRPFYNFRADPEFVWELADIGINLVSMANNHALDFGPEGLKECLRTLDHANITYAGAGRTLAEAHEPGTTGVQSRKTRFALLSCMRYWTPKYRCADPDGPCLATIDPAAILVAGKDGTVETVEGPVEADVKRMEDDIVLAKRHSDIVIVSLHVHDVSHSRAYGIQDTTPPNEEIAFRRAIDAGADMVIGTGPHVLRGIEIYRGKPIFYSLSDFIYQYRTPSRIPIDLIHQRDSEMERPANMPAGDRRDSRQVMEGVLVRFTINAEKLRRIELLPVTIDDEGPLYGAPRLASTRRSAEILELLQKLSTPYRTTLVNKGWYAAVRL